MFQEVPQKGNDSPFHSGIVAQEKIDRTSRNRFRNGPLNPQSMVRIQGLHDPGWGGGDISLFY